MKEQSSIWITWEKQIRNESMSRRLNAEYFSILSSGSMYKRYFSCGVRTVALLFRNRKKIIFVQNPSIVLALIAVLFKKIVRYKLIIDAHNSGVYPHKRLQAVANFINSNANFVIVTNESLAQFIRGIGGRPLILPDPLPDVTCEQDEGSRWNKMPFDSVMVICSWASDEPYVEIIRAAKLTSSTNFYITGNSKGREKEYEGDLPTNLILTGYVSENDYRIILQNSSVVLDLTTRESCLVCGAYEAVSACKPLILSDTIALRAYFGGVARFVQNDAESISEAVKEVFASYDHIREELEKNVSQIESKWNSMFISFRKEIFNSQKG